MHNYYRQLKADHLLRMNVTQEDERFYREPEPLTDQQREAMLHEVEEIKRRVAERENQEQTARRRKYEGTEIRDHYNH